MTHRSLGLLEKIMNKTMLTFLRNALNTSKIKCKLMNCQIKYGNIKDSFDRDVGVEICVHINMVKKTIHMKQNEKYERKQVAR